ncbi:SurA N-terminal domain-containing protein [Pseudoduganella chitinolytica]|uniref:Periplasmic chaperone PpiD n=1 Tax=Pseudoduganella chitinolytica TaxID=34070 RepID=A0ABY8BF05_9BURK|nr:SurA N-terminal domain-containing protein [Pseudoduganella chitinolytica]WEF34484.1 SurA N-terminal domain-containing protein [Pseudoduganella chitinolytica]
MFEFIRTHQKLMQILLAIVIVPSFVLVGVSGYESFGDDATTVAKVNGQSVTQQEYDQALRRQLDQYRQRLGTQFDQKLFDTPEFRQSVLDNLIAQRAIVAEASRSHLGAVDAAVQRAVAESLQDIPGMFKADGKLDEEKAANLIASQTGLTPEGYFQSLKRDLTIQQLAAGVQGSAFAPRAVAQMVSNLTEQERDVQELVLPLTEFVAGAKVTDAMVKSFYDKNDKLFQVPEQARIEYVVFDANAIASTISVTDEEVAAVYNAAPARFTAPEERRASHILVAVDKAAKADVKAAAKAKAEAILADVRKAPGEFAKIAKAKSEDPGSAEQGGDLGVIEKGSLVPTVEASIFKLKQGEISDIVESEFGYHVITVTSLKPAAVRPLDAVKGDIAADLKKQKAAKKYSEAAETFTNTVYEQADSLKPVADKLGLKIETAASVTRTPNPVAGQAPYNNARFLTALFSEDSLKNKRNTEAVEAAPSTLIAGRIIEFKPASKRPLAEVEAQIRQQVMAQEALAAAKKAGEAKLEAVKASGDTAGFGAVQTISRAKIDGISPLAARAVLKADVSKLPAYVGVELPGMGYGIYRIGKVHQPAQADAARRSADAEQIDNIVAQQDMANYVEVLKERAKVKVMQPAGAKPAEAAQ